MKNSGKLEFEYQKDRVGLELIYTTKGDLKSKAKITLPTQNGFESSLFAKAVTTLDKTDLQKAVAGFKFNKNDLYGNLFWKLSQGQNFLGGKIDANIHKGVSNLEAYNCGVGGKF